MCVVVVMVHVCRGGGGAAYVDPGPTCMAGNPVTYSRAFKNLGPRSTNVNPLAPPPHLTCKAFEGVCQQLCPAGCAVTAGHTCEHE